MTRRTFSHLLIFVLLAVGLSQASCEPRLPPLPPNAAKSFFKDPSKFSMNQKPFPKSNPNQFNFVVAGHIYGAHDDALPHPAQTLQDHLSDIVNLNPAMFVSLGDIVPHATAADFDQLESQIFSRITFPVFNTVGNHDVENRALYESRYHRTNAAFRLGPAYLVYLDTQANPCKITGDQLTMLQAALQYAVDDSYVLNIFVFMHNVIFVNDPLLYESGSRLAAPNEWVCYDDNNYDELRTNIFLPAARIKPVYLFAGDVGAWGGNLSPYYQKDPDANLTTITTGIGDTPQDSLLEVLVNKDEVHFKVIGLGGQDPGPLEQYNLTYWQRVAGETGKK